MSNSSFPGADAMSNSVDFVKKMWGGMGVPGMVVPIISVEEIDKKVTDLKAVEGWLSLNLNMLRTTIQALEVQSATLTALQSIGALMPSAEGKAAASMTDAPAIISDGAAAWSAMASQFPFSFMPGKAQAANQSVTPPVTASVAPEPVVPVVADPAPATATASAASAAASTGVWWDVLQNQFKQAVSSVMATEAAPDTGGKSATGKTATKAATVTRAAKKSGSPAVKSGSKATLKKNPSGVRKTDPK